MHTTQRPTNMPTVGLDWLAVSLSYADQHQKAYLDRLPEHLGFGVEGVTACNPRLGYGRGATDVRTGATVLWDGRAPNMGVHVIWSGGALDDVRSRFGNLDEVREHLARLQTHGELTVKRADVAYDQEVITPADLVNADAQGRLVIRTQAPVVELQGSAGGWTSTAGRRGAVVYVRCYDKAAEQEPNAPLIADRPRWYRLEYECREDLADRVVALWLERRWVEVGKHLARACSVRLKTEDTNRSRWPIDPAWKDVLGCSTLAPRVVTTAPGVAGVEDTWAWLATQTPRALALLAQAWGVGTLHARLQKLMDMGATRLTHEDAAALAAWRTHQAGAEEE